MFKISADNKTGIEQLTEKTGDLASNMIYTSPANKINITFDIRSVYVYA